MKKNVKCNVNISVVFFIVVILIAIIGKIYTPYDPNLVDMSNMLRLPCKEHIFGTDNLGRDLFSRVLCGAWTTISTAIIILVLASFIGIVLGLVSGYIGGKFDFVVTMLIDALVAFPDYIVAMVLSGILGGGTINLIVAIVSVKWITYARLTRSIVTIEKNKDYISIAKINGLNSFNILKSHILLHVLSSVLAIATVDIGKIILMIASLSYIGIGVQPPNPEWGYMLNEGRTFFASAPHLMIAPGLAIMFTILSINLFGGYVSKYYNVEN